MSKQPVTESTENPIEYTTSYEDVIGFAPFPIPNYAKIVQMGPYERPQDIMKMPVIHMDRIPEEVLEGLCRQMLDSIYKKANKKNPFITAYVDKNILWEEQNEQD